MRRALLLALLATGSCKHDQWPGPRPEAAVASATSEPIVVTPAPDRSAQSHPRILLTGPRLDAARTLARTGQADWKAVLQACGDATTEKIEAGYEAWDWVQAGLSCAFAYHVTKNEAFARTSLQYWKALLDDEKKVGDAAGGAAIVHGDDGYGIRTHGLFGAILFDWLHDVPGMTPELRKHAVDRFVAWTDWFGASGYNHDKPISNYYVGYFGAVAFAGLAAEGDDPRATQLRRHSREMFARELAPALKTLAGGDWPEGWQYGSLVAAIVAFYADAEGGGARGQVPWLSQVVEMRAAALWPDGKHLFDNGDWEKKPATASANELIAIAAVLPETDPASPHALSLATLAKNPHDDWPWLWALVASRTKREDPRRGGASYLAPGTGTLFARTSWSPAAVWVAFSSSPYLADHQHADAGGFEIVRGGDALVVDPSGYGSYATSSHNCLLVDDGKENLVYAPNQGSWGADTKIARFEDTGPFAYGQADFTSSYDPDGYPGDHPARSVTRAERELLFVRGKEDTAKIVIYDRVSLGKPSYGVTSALHGASTPLITGGTVRFVSGNASATVVALLPVSPILTTVREPSLKSDDAFTRNDPVEGMSSTRVEIGSPKGTIERRFLEAIFVGKAADKAGDVARIEGQGADGAAMDTDAFVFSAVSQASPQPLSYRAPTGVTRHVVGALAPDGHYTATLIPDGAACRVVLAAGGTLVASRAGVLTLAVSGCKLAR